MSIGPIRPPTVRFVLAVSAVALLLAVPVLAFTSGSRLDWPDLGAGGQWRESPSSAVVDDVAPWVSGSMSSGSSQLLSGWAFAAYTTEAPSLYIPLVLKGV